jgi:hypothetical protein
VTGVGLWRTADGDGIAGGALVTADPCTGVHHVSLSPGHIAFDESTDDTQSSGVNAAGAHSASSRTGSTGR